MPSITSQGLRGERGLVPRDPLNGGSGAAAAAGDAAGSRLCTWEVAFSQRGHLQRVPPTALASRRGPAGPLGAGNWDLEVIMKTKLPGKWQEMGQRGSIAAKKPSGAKHTGRRAGMRLDVDVFPTSADDPGEGSLRCEMLLLQLTAAALIGTLVP